MTLIAGKQWCLFFTGDDDEVFMTRRFNVSPKTTEQHLIVRSGESETVATNNKRLRLMYCTVEANYRQTGSTARPLCDSRATLYTCHCSVSHQSMHVKNAVCGRNRIFTA